MAVSNRQVVTLKAQDYAEIVQLWTKSGLPVKLAGRDSAEQFNKQIEGGTQVVLGIRGGNQLIGVVVVTHDGRKGWINRLSVHPHYRRQGIGSQLIEAAEALLRSRGFQIVAALIEDWNESSLALFRQAGYTVHRDIYYLTKRESDDV